MPAEDGGGYGYADAALAHTHGYLLGPVVAALDRLAWPTGPRRVFDLGCGNGAALAALAARGYIGTGSAYDDLAARYGQFTAVLSLEVVEHVYFPRKYAQCVFDLLQPGGTALISTPYHGYLKNVALAVAGKMDAHFTALWDYGHIKFWPPRTLTALLSGAGLEVERIIRVGRVLTLAKSMIAVARRRAAA